MLFRVPSERETLVRQDLLHSASVFWYFLAAAMLYRGIMAAAFVHRNTARRSIHAKNFLNRLVEEVLWITDTFSAECKPQTDGFIQPLQVVDVYGFVLIDIRQAFGIVIF